MEKSIETHVERSDYSSSLGLVRRDYIPPLDARSFLLTPFEHYPTPVIDASEKVLQASTVGTHGLTS